MPTTQKSLELQQALKMKLLENPDRYIFEAKSNIHRWEKNCNWVSPYINEWRAILEEGIDTIIDIFNGDGEHCFELLRNSPFTSVLTQDERLNILFQDNKNRAEVIDVLRKIRNGQVMGKRSRFKLTAYFFGVEPIDP